MMFFKKNKNDILLIAVILVAAAALLIWRAANREVGSSVEIRVDGVLLATLPLDKDDSMVIGDGDHTNTLVIQGGVASISSASCPDHVCMKRGTIRYDGESIVCLPNRLVVTVINGEDSGIDITTR